MHVLGAVLAVLSAATFALTNATGRRGVITGTPVQGMVISIPVGLLCFLLVALLTGALENLSRISVAALGIAFCRRHSPFCDRAILQLPSEPSGGCEFDCAGHATERGRHARPGGGRSA